MQTASEIVRSKEILSKIRYYIDEDVRYFLEEGMDLTCTPHSVPGGGRTYVDVLSQGGVYKWKYKVKLYFPDGKVIHCWVGNPISPVIKLSVNDIQSIIDSGIFNS